MSRGHLFGNTRECQWLIFLFYFFAVPLLTLLPEIDEFHRDGMLPNVVPSNSCQNIFKRLFVVLMDQPVLSFFSKHVDATNSHHFKFAIQPLSTNLNVDIPLMYFKVTSNLTPR